MIVTSTEHILQTEIYRCLHQVHLQDTEKLKLSAPFSAGFFKKGLELHKTCVDAVLRN